MFKEFLDETFVFTKVDQKLRYTWFYNFHVDFTREEVIGKTAYEIYPNSGTLKLMELQEKAIKTEKCQKAIISFPTNIDIISAKPLYDNERLIGAATVSMEITEIAEQIDFKEQANFNNSKYDIGKKIKLLRKKEKLTQSELARRAALSQSYISSLERNKKNPTIYSLKLICNALNMEPRTFFNMIF